jgi:MOSC domain-containing protein YiiM
VRVVSVQVGGPREVEWQGERLQTSIFKSPVGGRVRVRGENLEGDAQSDLSVHGGPEKAVYAYPSEHYAFWRAELEEADLPWGAFGENLTLEGLLEDTVGIGDRLQIGSVELVVTQPRVPCFKLGIRLGREGIVERFRAAGRSGFYLSIAREGELGAGDAVVHVRAPRTVSVRDIARLQVADAPDRDLLRRASELPALPASWRERFREQLGEPRA